MAASLATYKKRLAFQKGSKSMAYHAKGAKRVYASIGKWLEKYRGGLPVGAFASFAWYESNGRMDVPIEDRVLQEVGYFQISKGLPGHFGIDPAKRYIPEVNVFLGGLEYNDEAARYAALYPQIVLGSADNWKIARLVFAVGRGGTRKLLNLTKKSVGLRRSDVYGSLIKYIDKVGGIDLGRGQPAPKVWFRVHMASMSYRVGQMAIEGRPGPPRFLPKPRQVRKYKVSAQVAEKLLPVRRVKETGSILPTLVAAAGFGLFVGHVRRSSGNHS